MSFRFWVITTIAATLSILHGCKEDSESTGSRIGTGVPVDNSTGEASGSSNENLSDARQAFTPGGGVDDGGSGAAGQPLEPGDQDGGDDPDPAPVDPQLALFQAGIGPTIKASCAVSGCHLDSENIGNGLLSATDDALNRNRLRAYAATGDVFARVSAALPHGPAGDLDLTAQLSQMDIEGWLADENLPVPDLNLTAYRFFVAAAVNTSCIGCHANTPLNGGTFQPNQDDQNRLLLRGYAQNNNLIDKVQDIPNHGGGNRVANGDISVAQLQGWLDVEFPP